MSGEPLGTLPDPTDHLSEEARRTWYEAGIKLLRSNHLTEKSLKMLSDLCYWEDQRLAVLQKLRNAQSSELKISGNEERSVYLENLKAVKQEIDGIRNELGLEKKESDLVSDTPVLPDEAYESLPSQLQLCCSRINENDKKDLLLLSILPLIASLLPNLLAEHADGYYTPSLNIFLLDGSGAAKQLAEKAKTVAFGDLTASAHPEEINVHSLREELETADDGKKALQKKMRTIVEADLDFLLKDDTIVRAPNDIKLLFDRAFTASPVVVRSGKGELSALLIGDMHQFKKLSLKTGSDLFSLFMVYSSNRESSWQSNRPNISTRSLSKDLAGLGSDLARIGSMMAGRKEPLTVELSTNQWQMIDDTFAEKMEIIDELGLPAELQTVNRKTAIYALKVSAIFTVLRAFDNETESLTREYLTPKDDDVIAALWLADTCLKHAIRLNEILPGNKQTDARGERYQKYQNILPARFETADALELADKLNIPARSAKRYLNALVEEKRVIRIKRGVYEKIG